MYTIGVDLGGTQIRAGIYDESGQLLCLVRDKTLAQEGKDAVISRLKKAIWQTIHKSCVSMEKVKGIGIGCPGPLNLYTGEVLSPPNLPDWDHVPLRDLIAKEFGLPVFLSNDANAAALGEYFYGHGKGVKNLVYITVSTGIGGGIIVDDRLLQGHNGNAGEIGHMVIESNGPKCSCGNYGCLGTLASGTGIVRQTLIKLAKSDDESVLRKMTEKLTSEMIFNTAKAGDRLAMEVAEETRRYLGIGFANVINLFNPEMIIFGGGVTKVGDFLMIPAIEEAKRRAFKGMSEGVQFLPAKCGDDVGVIGAAALVDYHSKPDDY